MSTETTTATAAVLPLHSIDFRTAVEEAIDVISLPGDDWHSALFSGAPDFWTLSQVRSTMRWLDTQAHHEWRNPKNENASAAYWIGVKTLEAASAATGCTRAEARSLKAIVRRVGEGEKEVAHLLRAVVAAAAA